ncbi:MAG TPA: signal recognition particle-docking protein FtsY [Candidatus Nanoarchaeia archaeon]|nr:signal recognition particle-docking protein FtsY [Candidatus Nanoarchaeia archaeon]
MFKFLKEKLQGAISKLAKKVEDEAKEEVVEVEKTVAKKTSEEKKQEEGKEKGKPEEKKSFFQKIFGKKEEKKEEEVKERTGRKAEEEKEKIPEKIVQEKEYRKEFKVIEREKEPLETKKTEEPEIEVKREAREEKQEKKKEVKEEKKNESEEEIEPEEKRRIDIVKEAKEELTEKTPEKKSFFGKIIEKITTKTISSEQFDDLFWELEVVMLENNVAVEVIEKIKEGLKAKIVNVPIPRSKVSETIAESLRDSITGLFDVGKIDLLSRIKSKKPFVIVFVGVNGSGKTTTIAKMARFCQKNNLSVVIAAGDTFRAAAIDQLEVHAKNLGIKMIKQDYGSDSAAVAFDAIKHAEATGRDVVLVDTAGRLHSNVNLMDEMKKIIRVAKPDIVLFVGESITGNDCVEQAKKFNEAIGIDGIVLAKADVDEKGGAAISVSYVTKKPILYLGTGQGYDDLAEFDSRIVIDGLGL